MDGDENNKEVEEFITQKLSGLALEDEAIAEYFARLVVEEYMEETDKREAISELLADVTEEPTETIIDEVFVFWNGMQAKEKAKEEEAKVKAMEAAKEKEKFVLSNFGAPHIPQGAFSISSRHVIKNLTKEERKKRDALLAQYGYEDLDEMVEGANGEMEIVYKDRSGGSSKVSTSDPLLMANNNAEIIKQKEAARRAEMKKASETEKERNKAALEKQKLDKEKEKRRTQKSEKRRM